MEGRATIRDVALLAGVSIKTVSRVLNNSPLVTPRTRATVENAVRMLDYQPNAQARALVTRRSGTIGLIIADITNPVFPATVRGVQDAAESQGYHVLLCNTDERPGKEMDYLALFRQNKVDGVILAGSRVGAKRIDDLGRSGVPVVLVNRALRSPTIGTVSVDNAKVGRAAVEYLASKGHHTIGYIGGPRRSASNRDRYAGYLEGLALCRLKLDRSIVADGLAPTRDGGRLGMQRLLKAAPPRPTAVLAYNDLMALGALDAIREAGLQVPGDMAVVGVDDIDLAAFARPSLTTFRLPKYRMGYVATEILSEMIDRGPQAARKVVMETELIERESAG